MRVTSSTSNPSTGFVEACTPRHHPVFAAQTICTIVGFALAASTRSKIPGSGFQGSSGACDWSLLNEPLAAQTAH